MGTSAASRPTRADPRGLLEDASEDWRVVAERRHPDTAAGGAGRRQRGHGTPGPADPPARPVTGASREGITSRTEETKETRPRPFFLCIPWRRISPQVSEQTGDKDPWIAHGPDGGGGSGVVRAAR